MPHFIPPTGPSQPPSSASSPSPRRLDQAVRALFGMSWGDARKAISSGKIAVDGVVQLEESFAVTESAVITHDANRPRPRMALAGIAGTSSEVDVVFCDAQVVVANKPPGLSTIPFDDEPDTLDRRVREFLKRRGEGKKKGGGAVPPLGIVHRIDKETSGLVVFTRTWLAKQKLSSQFRSHTVQRSYLAICHGQVQPRTITSHLIENRGDGLRGSIEALRARRGSGAVHGEGKRAVTHVEVLERFASATLVSCKLETGKTHQIRIHLSEAGHPIVGERVYIRDFLDEPIRATRLMLHAKELGFIHPTTDENVHWEREPPEDFEKALTRLRAAAKAP